MPDKNNLIDLLMEQLAIDALLNNLDRNLFYLPTRIKYEDYMGRLNGKKVKENKSVGVTVETDYEIIWASIIPDRWFKLNPYLSVHFESSAKLKTTFYKEIIKTQILVFQNSPSPEMLYELFRNNSNWEVGKDRVGEEVLESKDGKYIVRIINYNSEDFDFLDSSTGLWLLYK